MKETEIFKDIPNYEELYQVSNLGRVKSLKCNKEIILKGYLDAVGYLNVSLHKNERKTSKIHKLVSIVFLNHKPCKYELVVNHINFDKLDNRVSNLEIITQRENTNQKHMKSSSKYTGVCWLKVSKKWMSQIRINGKTKYLGCFTDELEASEAYEKALCNLS